MSTHEDDDVELEADEEQAEDEDEADEADETPTSRALTSPKRRRGRPEGSSRFLHLRQEAALAFISDPACSTLEFLARDSRFTEVSPRTLSRWCNEDGWLEKRQKFMAEFSRKALSKLQDVRATHLHEEYEQLVSLKKEALSRLKGPGAVEAKSWESVLAGYMKIAERIENITMEIQDRLLPKEEKSTLSDEASKAPISQTESELLARELLRLRRESMAAEIAANPPVIPVDTKPVVAQATVQVYSGPDGSDAPADGASKA